MNNHPRHIAVYGAGAVGTYFGSWLSEAGFRTTLLGRGWLKEGERDVRAQRHDGASATLRRGGRVVLAASELRPCDICFVTVKSRDTLTAGRTLRNVLRPGAHVVSLQNGRNNAAILREALGPEFHVSAAVVGFNVRQVRPLHFVETVPGALYLSSTPPELRELATVLETTGFSVRTHEEIDRVVDGKLLLNTNNGVSAATGSSVAELMRDRDARWLFAQCLKEGVAVLEAMGCEPAKVATMGPLGLAKFLQLPDLIVRPLLRFGNIDEDAMTSTLDDLLRGRATEIGELNGELVARGRSVGVATPVNAALTDIVRALEIEAKSGHPIRFIPASTLREQCAAQSRRRMRSLGRS